MIIKVTGELKKRQVVLMWHSLKHRAGKGGKLVGPSSLVDSLQPLAAFTRGNP